MIWKTNFGYGLSPFFRQTDRQTDRSSAFSSICFDNSPGRLYFMSCSSAGPPSSLSPSSYGICFQYNNPAARLRRPPADRTPSMPRSRSLVVEEGWKFHIETRAARATNAFPPPPFVYIYLGTCPGNEMVDERTNGRHGMGIRRQRK